MVQPPRDIPNYPSLLSQSPRGTLYLEPTVDDWSIDRYVMMNNQSQYLKTKSRKQRAEKKNQHKREKTKLGYVTITFKPNLLLLLRLRMFISASDIKESSQLWSTQYSIVPLPLISSSFRKKDSQKAAFHTECVVWEKSARYRGRGKRASQKLEQGAGPFTIGTALPVLQHPHSMEAV